MSTTIVYPLVQNVTPRSILDPLALMSGDILTVYLLKVQEEGTSRSVDYPYKEIFVIKLGGNTFKDLGSPSRFRVKVPEGVSTLKRLIPLAAEAGWNPLKVYEISKVDTTLMLGEAKRVR